MTVLGIVSGIAAAISVCPEILLAIPLYLLFYLFTHLPVWLQVLLLSLFFGWFSFCFAGECIFSYAEKAKKKISSGERITPVDALIEWFDLVVYIGVHLSIGMIVTTIIFGEILGNKELSMFSSSASFIYANVIGYTFLGVFLYIIIHPARWMYRKWNKHKKNTPEKVQLTKKEALAVCQHKLHKLFCTALGRLDSFQFGSFFFSIDTHTIHQFFQFGKG